jgi:hypothetical protein
MGDVSLAQLRTHMRHERFSSRRTGHGHLDLRNSLQACVQTLVVASEQLLRYLHDVQNGACVIHHESRIQLP